jgi:uncharacterized membrane protein
MHSGVKILGHSVHPILIVFPLGLLATAVVFDLVGFITTNGVFTVVAYWMIASGLIGGLLAAIFGWLDWLQIPVGTRGRRIGLTHGLVNTVVLLFYAVSFYFRIDDSTHPQFLATIFSTVGAGIALVGGWLGGELVERLGVSVHPGANTNAPSSLTHAVIPEKR